MEPIKYDGLTKTEIIELPTLLATEYDLLKREDYDNEDRIRVWVSIFEVLPDGSPQVTVERLFEGEWEVVEIF